MTYKTYNTQAEIKEALAATKDGQIVALTCYASFGRKGEFEGRSLHLVSRSGTDRRYDLPKFKAVEVDPYTDNPKPVGRASTLVYEWIKEITLTVA